MLLRKIVNILILRRRRYDVCQVVGYLRLNVVTVVINWIVLIIIIRCNWRKEEKNIGKYTTLIKEIREIK
jgi:hypothetical protein